MSFDYNIMIIDAYYTGMYNNNNIITWVREGRRRKKQISSTPWPTFGVSGITPFVSHVITVFIMLYYDAKHQIKRKNTC